MLHEKYRPKRLEQVIGNGRTIAELRRLMSAPGWDRDAFWIEGKSGTGKTTIAKCLATALEVDPFFIHELDGHSCTVEAVRRIEETIHLFPWTGRWKLYIVNEAQSMTPRSVQAWLTLLEKLPQYRLVVFTTTVSIETLFNDFSHPMKSRVKFLKLRDGGMAKLSARLVMKIATREKLNGKPIGEYVQLARRCRNNIREMLQEVELGRMLPRPKTGKAKR